MNFEKLLSPSQYLAATTLDAPICILAGAGTGKTRVITHRIAYLVSQGVEPESILGLTFTNKAAGEMRERVDHLLPGMGRRVELGTFHSLGAKWLRQYGHFVEVSPSFVIYDSNDSEKILKELALNAMNLSKDYLSFYEAQIDSWQNEGLHPEQVDSRNDQRLMRARELYRLYNKRLQAAGALDFNSILIKVRDLTQKPEAIAALQKRFRHILVDEYQDTNAVQSEIVYALGKSADSVAIVGDDDQSIYGWRGAKPYNLEEFLTRMPGTQLIKLEENYRSTSAILNAANAIISNNDRRLGKTLISKAGAGQLVRVIRTTSDRYEADLVIHQIEHRVRQGRNLNDIAILMRANAQSRPFEEALRFAQLPYRLVGGVKFYDRKEIKDILSILRTAVNPKSDLDLVRALLGTKQGVGATSVSKAQSHAAVLEISLFEVFRSSEKLAHAGLSKKTAEKIVAFSKALEELGQASLNAAQAIQRALDISGREEKIEEERLENLEQLISAAQQYVEDCEVYDQDPSILGFLENAALLSSVDEMNNREHTYGAVTLMTLHAAKGLEFHTVYMVGMEEYGFPHARALEDTAKPDDLEEERRLAYVGMTRAREELILTYATRRLIRGQIKGRAPSRFLRELPKDWVTGDLPYQTFS
ncbi:MAG: UvrD-helicase domain-containing protein [Myxococcaceae bacterium]|nr:UvrD-helicase domain-containing protein [Myxococcaceae bacterium]MBH2006634.1 UvrD-helicase domain-containing protein [Myxococcaceae bacterium]